MTQKTKPIPKPYTSRSWDRSHGEYIAGRAALDGVDAVAVEMEGKWGNGRLRLLVDAALREKFDRQRYKLNMAVTNGGLDDVRREAPRMVNAWRALDKAAEAAGATHRPTEVWELTLEDGTVVGIVQDAAVISREVPLDRRMAIFTTDEIARLLMHYRELLKPKVVWPGATVVQVRKVIPDPLDGIREATGLDDPIDDLWNA